jgi:1-aminocyclopropane-1-carboxylate deaminase/D-cysteine desulfhydrase-like pyridoxal-dependent ACC family enzyme
LIQDTITEEYMVKNRKVFVKREDQACLPPGPPFAKVRGLLPVLERLKKEGFKNIGYMDTSVSMAGWGISYFCKKLGLNPIIFTPMYKDGYRDNQRFQIQKWQEFDAEIMYIKKPNRMMINYYKARKILFSRPNSYMLPLGLPFKETVESVNEQLAMKTPKEALGGSLILCIGSGTMAAGVLKGCYIKNVRGKAFGILVSRKDPDLMRKKIFSMGGFSDNPAIFWGYLPLDFAVIDYGYEYTVKEECQCPFPCSPYYDRKAWKWLLDNIERLKDPILFWNIGA